MVVAAFWLRPAVPAWCYAGKFHTRLETSILDYSAWYVCESAQGFYQKPIQPLYKNKRLNQLREKGFPDAYIHTHINQDNSVLYRVRVGKVPKDKAEDRAFELRRLNFIDSVQITRI